MPKNYKRNEIKWLKIHQIKSEFALKKFHSRSTQLFERSWKIRVI